MVSIQRNWWNFRYKHGRESINSVLKWLSDYWWLNVSDQILASQWSSCRWFCCWRISSRISTGRYWTHLCAENERFIGLKRQVTQSVWRMCCHVSPGPQGADAEQTGDQWAWLTLTSVFVHLQKVKMRPLHQCDFLFPSKTYCIQSDPCSATVRNKLHKNDGCI